MKKLALAFLLCAAPAQAAPYLVLPWHHDYERQFITEACFNPNAGIGATTSCTSILAAEHPGYGHGTLLVPGVDWAVPVGLATNFRGTNLFVTGVSVNVLPAAKGVMLKGLDASTKEGSFENLKSLLEPPTVGTPDVTINVGVKWGLAPQQNWKGYLVLSVGPRLTFGGAGQK